MDCDSKITNTGVYGKSLWQLVICYTVTIVIVLELAICAELIMVSSNDDSTILMSPLNISSFPI